MIRGLLALVLAVIVASCHGGGSGSSGGNNVPPGVPAAPMIDVTAYLAQWRCLDGSPPMNCSNPAPQLASDQMTWRRWDGWDQVEDTVADPARGFYESTWSYAPFGQFDASHGDGGEVMVRNGSTVSITATQDGGTPGIQRFAIWGLFNDQTVDCAQGWTPIDLLDRACHTTMTFPASGYGLTQIVADTIVSEHWSGLGYTGDLERFYLAKGWGRLCWSAHNANPPRTGMAPSCGAGDPVPASAASDRRLITNLIPNAGLIQSIADYGWPPPGFTP